jgi:hypothetical protein
MFVSWKRGRRNPLAPSTEPMEVIEVPAEAQDLGKHEGGFSAAASGRGTILGSLGSLVLVAGIGSFILTHTKPEEMVLGSCMVGGFVLVCLIFLVLGIRKLGYKLALFENGLVETRGRASRVFRWDEVDALRGMVRVPFMGRPVCLGGPMVVRRCDGATLTLGHGVDNVERLAGVITDQVMQRLLPAALEAIRRNKHVTIGTLQVDGDGLTRNDGERLTWDEFNGFSFTPDRITLHQTGTKKPWWNHTLGGLWNARLLLDLTRELAREGA